jgi:predicted nicotinamide N-methyase
MDAMTLLASGRASRIRVLSPSFESVQIEKTLDLLVPYSTTGCSIDARADAVENIESEAVASRRLACGRSAAARLGKAGIATVADRELDLDDDVERPGESALLLRLSQPDVAGSIGGKIWDASLLFAAWLAENPHRLPPSPASGSAPPRVLGLGSGLGVTELSCALLHRHLHVTLSDYDPAVNASLEQSVRQSCAECELRPDVTRVDFRDFTSAAVEEAESATRATTTPPLQLGLQCYAAAGLLHSFDCIIAADVCYEASSSRLLPWIVRALLKPPPPADEPGAWRPCALLVLPDVRPRLKVFVESVPAAGLRCSIHRLAPDSRLRTRLTDAHEGWGADNSFSLYSLEWAACPSVS